MHANSIIVELHWGTGLNNLTYNRIRTRTIQSVLHVVDIGLVGAVLRHQFQTSAVVLQHQAKIGHAETQCVAEKRLENSLEFSGRAGNYPKNLVVAVCCSSDSVRSAVRCRSSLSSRVFSMAMTA